MSLLNMKRLHSLCKDKELSAFAGSSSSLNILPIFNPSLILGYRLFYINNILMVRRLLKNIDPLDLL